MFFLIPGVFCRFPSILYKSEPPLISFLSFRPILRFFWGISSAWACVPLLSPGYVLLGAKKGHFILQHCMFPCIAGCLGLFLPWVISGFAGWSHPGHFSDLVVNLDVVAGLRAV